MTLPNAQNMTDSQEVRGFESHRLHRVVENTTLSLVNGVVTSVSPTEANGDVRTPGCRLQPISHYAKRHGVVGGSELASVEASASTGSAPVNPPLPPADHGLVHLGRPCGSPCTLHLARVGTSSRSRTRPPVRSTAVR